MDGNIKEIKLGKKNDCFVYAIECDGHYYPLNRISMEHQSPDAIIRFDQGLYPGITDIHEYMCDKASDII